MRGRTHPLYRIDILACSVASNDGMRLVDRLEEITDVNFAASTDPTGASADGNFDYELESEEAGLNVANEYFELESIRGWVHYAGLASTAAVNGGISKPAHRLAQRERENKPGNRSASKSSSRAASRLSIIDSLLLSPPKLPAPEGAPMMDGGAVSSQPRFEPPQRFEPTLQQIPSSERSEVLAPEEVANHTPRPDLAVPQAPAHRPRLPSPPSISVYPSRCGPRGCGRGPPPR